MFFPQIKPRGSVAALALWATWAAAANAAPPTAPAGYRWQAIAALSDEFNATHLDESKWRPGHPYAVGHDRSHFVPENVTVENGYLWLKAGTLLPDGSASKDQAWISVGCVSSLKPISSYGYYEARLKASKLPMVSAFWFQNSKIEIDVQEGVGAPNKYQSTYEMIATSHYFPNGWKSSIQSQNHAQTSSPVSEFHVYGVWWKDSRTLYYYLDGREIGRQTPPGPFDSPMYMFLNTEHHLAVGTPTLADVKNDKLNTMAVDWVRAYSLVKK